VSTKLGSFIAVIAVCILSLTACKNKADDAAIVSDIQTKLLQNHALNDYYVHVESRGGAVILSGTVLSATARQAIDALSNTTGRTTSFADKIAVVELPSISPATSDSAIEAEVRAKFSANPILSKQTIEVASSGGVLTLAGSVGSAAQKTQAEQLAEQTSGVRRVVDQLGVRSGVSPPSVSLKVNPQLITPGKSATVTWTSHNATSLDLEPGIGRVGAQGSRTISPQTSTTYTLIANGPQGQASATARVNIWNAVPPPRVTLNAVPSSVPRGQPTRVTWSSQGATLVDIEPGLGRVGPEGSQTVSPQSDTTYTLTATGPGGKTTATADVTVSNPVPVSLPPPSASLKASSESVTKGQSAMLNWTTENASNVSIQPDVGSVPAHGSVRVTPRQSTTYTLTAIGSERSAIARATVNVLPAGPSQGTIVWEGEVHGTSSVSIEGNHASIGNIVSGGLPGLPCTVRLENPKQATLQTSPAQWNGWKLIGLQVRGNGRVTVRISWSRPQ
jgi:osmotically-inducible protein OsmY